MSAETTFVVSDLHLGSEHFRQRDFLFWLDRLPAGSRLVLNGDIVDDARRPLGPGPRLVLERLIAESCRRPVVWVRGNHDEELVLPEPGRVEFVERWEIGQRLLIVHGAHLDHLMPRHGAFKWLFRRFHRLRVVLGFRDVHVAEYAKRWGFLYRVLTEHVARNALRAARERGFAAIACGHTHAAMDLVTPDGRYLNTGAWTERPLHYLRIEPDLIRLELFPGAPEESP